jgi:archaellum component FlaG (FlaF/FlaG flagellin family)
MRGKLLHYLLAGMILVALLAAAACGESEPPTPTSGDAEFELVSLDITPAEAAIGETVTVSVEVRNIGGSSGTYTAQLVVDGVVAKTGATAIAAGESQTITFSLVERESGSYQIEVGELSARLVVSDEPAKVVADASGTISDIPDSYPYLFVDIINLTVTVEGGEVEAQLELAELPKTLTFNQAPQGALEYEWIVYFDIDGDINTGTVVSQNVGAEYSLSINHWSSGEVVQGSIIDFCQIEFKQSEDSGLMLQPGAKAEFSYNANTITLSGPITGLTTESRWFAVMHYNDIFSGNVWMDRVPSENYATLAD